MLLVVVVVVVIYTIINFKRLSVTQAVLVMGWPVTVGVVKVGVVDTHYGSLLPVVEVRVFTHADVSMTTYRVDIY